MPVEDDEDDDVEETSKKPSRHATKAKRPNQPKRLNLGQRRKRSRFVEVGLMCQKIL